MCLTRTVAFTPRELVFLGFHSKKRGDFYSLAGLPVSSKGDGKGKDGECMDYALALSSRLAEHGIHGRLIFYRWHIRGTETEGSHVFVFYRLPDNSEWIVDNEIPHPRKVPADASLMDLVFLLSDTKAAPVDVELQNGLNHLSFF